MRNGNATPIPIAPSDAEDIFAFVEALPVPKGNSDITPIEGKSRDGLFPIRLGQRRNQIMDGAAFARIVDAVIGGDQFSCLAGPHDR